ncbi:DUF1801 domain-containing protein [Flavobacterium sp.]|jgi:hypothetical protein|uniref:DUF1801 domain-containing protein n=1 Tax=Flavobacterium sp. TaxID=239 RepID=UPI0037C00658
MDIKLAILNYLNNLPEPKRTEITRIHQAIIEIIPTAQLWFLEGTNTSGKVVTNPNIGYGNCTLQLAGGKTRAFYKIGLSANSTGISVYIMGIKDKNYLNNTYGSKIGKGKITGYCIKFRNLKDIYIEELIRAINTELENC